MTEPAVPGPTGPDRPVATSRLRAQIDLPAGVATWVLSAHALTLAAPFVLLWAAHAHAEALADVLPYPFLLDVAAGLFLLGSAFEVAQNTADRWYYEGPYPAFADLLFNGGIAVGLGGFALAAAGDRWWVVALVVAGIIAFPALYLTDRVPFPVTGVLGFLGVGALAVALRDPVIVLMLLFSPGLNLYFLAAIERTHAQALHGAIALSAGLGLVPVVVAIVHEGSGATTPWEIVVLMAAVVGLVAVLAWPTLLRLGATRRPSGLGVSEVPGQRFAATLVVDGGVRQTP